MVIRKQPIISWLLNKDYAFNPNEITICLTQEPYHADYLCKAMVKLADIRENDPIWGLPELLMPSFEKMMEKSEKSFSNISHQLFQEFSEEGVCGILLHRVLGTVVYGYGDNSVFVWLFKDTDGISVLYNYFYIESIKNKTNLLYACHTLMDDSAYAALKNVENFYTKVGNIVTTYLAVKKYAPVETIIVPDKEISVIEDTCGPYKHKEKVRNESGQEVIVMDSRWFVKIINDNDIFVRGFFRLQNKKNAAGEWYKELIFVDSFVRHGYHRKAKIENLNQECEKPLSNADDNADES